jgi:hypothetical protein
MVDTSADGILTGHSQKTEAFQVVIMADAAIPGERLNGAKGTSGRSGERLASFLSGCFSKPQAVVVEVPSFPNLLVLC